MDPRRTFAQIVVFRPDFRNRARALRSMEAGMILLVACTLVWWRMVPFRATRFSLRRSGAWTPRRRLVGIQHTNLFLILIPRTFLVGGAMMRFCFLLTPPRCRGSLFNTGSCASWRGRPPRRKLPKASFARKGNSGLLYKASNRKGAPRWRGPAKILDVDDAGATAKFQSPTFKVARNCVGR